MGHFESKNIGLNFIMCEQGLKQFGFNEYSLHSTISTPLFDRCKAIAFTEISLLQVVLIIFKLYNNDKFSHKK